MDKAAYRSRILTATAAYFEPKRKGVKKQVRRSKTLFLEQDKQGTLFDVDGWPEVENKLMAGSGSIEPGSAKTIGNTKNIL